MMKVGKGINGVNSIIFKKKSVFVNIVIFGKKMIVVIKEVN
jgi:hypothetical protein